MNPLMQASAHAFQAIPYDKIKPEHFLPALEEAIKSAKEKFEDIKKVTTPNFENVIEAGEIAEDRINYITNIYYALYSAECTEGINEISEKFSESLTRFSNDITLDPEIFAKVKAVFDNKDSMELNYEQKKVLTDLYTDFTRNGALLDEKQKGRLREIDERLSKVGLNFTENVRKATNAYFLIVKNEKDLEGMPEAVIEAAAEAAEKRDLKGNWVFTLEYPSFLPFMKYCKNEELRKEMNHAISTKATSGEYDNQSNIKEILELRWERAKLLGYENHAQFVLEKRMAGAPDKVMDFLNNIYDKSINAAKADFQKLKNLKKELTGEDTFNKWDTAFYTEILKKRELNIDDELLRPYFKLENVINGVFEIANKLYGINFKELNNIPKFHDDVMTYEVVSNDGDFVGLFYADFFPRETKRPGAWMTDLKEQGLMFGEVNRPFVSITCNFTKPTKTKPSLLTLDEVLTLFHEFGHALHGLLSKCTYRSVSGTSVYWDFVELPSQIMENWVTEKECLDLFAKHYETGESIPSEYIEKIKESKKFMEGWATLRQLSFGFLDMAWHTTDPASISNIIEFEDKNIEKYNFHPRDGKACMSCSFGHIFGGGYAAGYYSYKWAEVLDADAFEFFLEKGIFDADVAKSFKENILEKGGSEHPMELYKRFRGKEPDPDALLRRGGLI
jgi:peptidyl-dipeptidase Dcp